MTPPFTLAVNPGRILFGSGRILELPPELDRLGIRRALILSTPNQTNDAHRIAARLGPTAAAVFDGARMHTPVETTLEALALVERERIDGLVAFGGGSTTGLGKAIALRTDLPQVVIPTTYAGSEVTPILGQTEAGRKTTIRDMKVLPEVVIYDPDFTLELPVGMTVTSGLNAIAHAAEGLYSSERNPISSLQAAEGMRALARSLPRIVKHPRDPESRSDALYGAWLCGTVLGTVGMALHHKICHTLGGSFDLPHAETHAVMLPHTVGFNARVATQDLAPVREIFGSSPGAALYDFSSLLGAPRTLAELGMKRDDLDRAADIATASPYPNPRPLLHADIRALLEDAFTGRRPDP